MTLGFSSVGNGSGPRELPAPTLLATLLLAVESNRRDLLNRVSASFEEEVEAVAPLYWPFLIVRGPNAPGAAIFDVTGVWKQTFQYSFLPPDDARRALLEGEPSPAEFLERMRAATRSCTGDSGADVLTVEGFLPLEAPLQLELLSQSDLHASPPGPRSGFLPARHKVEWYEEEVERMQAWLARLDDDIASLKAYRDGSVAAVRAARGRIDQEQARIEVETDARVREAHRQSQEEIAWIQAAHHQEVLKHVERLGAAHRAVVHAETAIATSSTLSDRAGRRQHDTKPHQARMREARESIRAAHRQIREGRRAIEEVHHRQRLAQEGALAHAVGAERAGARTQSEHELFRDEFEAASAELLSAIDAQLRDRTAQKTRLSSYFLPLPGLAHAKIVWLPIWAATLRSPRGPRQLVFPPLRVRSGVGVAGTLRRLFGGMVLPLEPRAAPFDREFRSTVERALAHDRWLAGVTQELTSCANVLDATDLLPRLEEGFAELSRRKWISAKQASEFLRNYTVLVDRRRARASRGTASSVSGAEGDSVAASADYERLSEPGIT